MYNEVDKCVMTSLRSSDNCYLLQEFQVCCISTVDETEVCHQRLGHLNNRNLSKIVIIRVVRGIPKLNKKHEGVCGSCQLGKQNRVSHKVLQHITTTRALELLHMDLVGLMQVESTAGKKYIYVCVDD